MKSGDKGWESVQLAGSLLSDRRQTEKPSFAATARCDLSRVRNVRSRSGE